MRTFTRTIVGLEYRAVRTPLALIEGALIQRLPEGSRVRRAFDDGVHRLDLLASAVLSPPADATEQPASRPAPKRAAAQDTRADTRADARADTGTDLAEEQEQIVEAILSPEEEVKHVGELAEADEQTKLDLAELRAKHQLQELEEERARREGDA